MTTTAERVLEIDAIRMRLSGVRARSSSPAGSMKARPKAASKLTSPPRENRHGQSGEGPGRVAAAVRELGEFATHLFLKTHGSSLFRCLAPATSDDREHPNHDNQYRQRSFHAAVLCHVFSPGARRALAAAGGVDCRGKGGPMSSRRVLIACLVSLLALSGCSHGLKIHDRPIQFSADRVSGTLDYIADHYGESPEDISIVPKIIVLHWTAIDGFEETFAAFDPGGSGRVPARSRRLPAG